MKIIVDTHRYVTSMGEVYQIYVPSLEKYIYVPIDSLIFVYAKKNNWPTEVVQFFGACTNTNINSRVHKGAPIQIGDVSVADFKERIATEEEYKEVIKIVSRNEAKSSYGITMAMGLLIGFFLLFSFQAKAQRTDHCGCIIDLDNYQISVPYFKNALNIQFFFLEGTNGEYFPAAFISQVYYESWEKLIVDFPIENNMAVIKFKWNRLVKNSRWNFVKNFEDDLYLGMYFDKSRNHKVDETKIIYIYPSCFYPACSSSNKVFTIKVYLVDK